MIIVNAVKLGEIAEIINGIPDTKDEILTQNLMLTYNLIQPNHLGVFNDIQSFSEMKKQSPINDKYLIHNNDILFKRLNPDTVTLIDQKLINTTFSSNLLVIRIFKHYYPAYIACLLENQGMTWLESNLVGKVSVIRSISAKALAVFEIPDIEYNKQKVIGQMWLLHKKRKKLLDDLMVEDKRLITAVISSIISGTEEEK